MIFHTSDTMEAFDAKLFVEHLCDEGATIKIEKIE
jgi:hypothetical protein